MNNWIVDPIGPDAHSAMYPLAPGIPLHKFEGLLLLGDVPSCVQMASKWSMFEGMLAGVIQ